MNAKFKLLKGKYEDIGEQIRSLYETQAEIRDLMEKVCTHDTLHTVEADPFDYGVEEENSRKCEDCFRYFTESEARELEQSRTLSEK